MIIPGLGTLKTWALAALGMATAVLFGLWQMTRAGRAADRRKAAEKAVEVKSKATDAIVAGEQKKQEARDEDSSDMSHFKS